jgi:hypothetical protein
VKRPFQAAAQTSIDAHISLYRKLLNAADHLLPTEEDFVKSTLWHWDLHASNIFVTDNKVTSIIDWQDCWAGPLVLHSRRPRLLDYQGELMLHLPPHYKSLEEGEEKREIRSNVENSILLFTYESTVQRENPVLGRIFQLLHVPKIRETIRFATNTWELGLVPFRESLLHLRKNWDQIYPGQECPYTFTEDELSVHAKEGVRWKENGEFWSSISDLVTRDGFVAVEYYDKALNMFATLREEGLQMFEGDERANFEQETRWAMRAP